MGEQPCSLRRLSSASVDHQEQEFLSTLICRSCSRDVHHEAQEEAHTRFIPPTNHHHVSRILIVSLSTRLPGFTSSHPRSATIFPFIDGSIRRPFVLAVYSKLPLEKRRFTCPGLQIADPCCFRPVRQHRRMLLQSV